MGWFCDKMGSGANIPYGLWFDSWLLPIQLPSDAGKKAAKCGPSSWAPASMWKIWMQHFPIQIIMAIGGVKKRMEDLLFSPISFSHCNFFLNKS